MEEKTSSQMQNYHQLAKEKTAFVTWLEQFKMDCVTHQTWRSVLRQKRDSLLSDLKQVFPIGDLDGKRPTLRWILLPPTGFRFLLFDFVYSWLMRCGLIFKKSDKFYWRGL